MEIMAMSVVIPVSKDLQIKKCLESIDALLEVIVVLNNNPSQAVRKIAEDDSRCRLVFVTETGCNLAKVLNLGIQAASYEKVVIMNSDCWFPSGLLAKIYCELDDYPVVKTPVAFEYGNQRQKLVAECRRLFHQVLDGGRKLFGPGLAIRKSVKHSIGGYYFNEHMGWGEDGEMSRRIRQSSLRFLVLPDRIYHAAEGVWHDWQIAFRIGFGNGLKDRLALSWCGRAIRADIMNLISDHQHQFLTAKQEGGWLLWGYLLTWKLFFHLGYYITMLRKGV